MQHNSMIGSIGDSTKTRYFDLPLPEEILDIVMYYLDEEDLTNLTNEDFGSERIKDRANKALKTLKYLKGKQLYLFSQDYGFYKTIPYIATFN